MADERIQVTLSSRADLSGFAAYQAAAKGFGRENKDMFDGLTKSVAGLSASFKNDFTVAVSGAAGILGEFVRGGLWGLLGAVANQAVGYVVDRFKEAKERAQEFANVLMAEVVAGMEGVNAAVKGLAAEIGKANKDVDDFIKTSNGKIAARAKYDVARLHVETLQKMTDGMSDAAKGVVLADEALKAGLVRQTAAVEAAAAEVKALNGRKAALAAQAEQAEANLAAAQKARAEFEETYSRRLGDHSMLQYLAGRTVEQLVAEGMSLGKAYKEHERATRRLREFEEKEKTLIEKRGVVVQGVADAEKALADATGERAKLSARIKDAEGRRAAAELELEAANLDLSARKRQAEAALEAENAAAKKRADDEYYRAELAKTEGRIMRVCNANRVESAKYLALFNRFVDEGADEEDAFVKLQKELNRELGERAKAEKDAAAKTKAQNAAQQGLADVNARLAKAAAARERAEKIRSRVDSGIAKDQAAHGGISGNGYGYRRDKDGNLTRFDQFRRARRYADRAARDEASANRDGNAERNARRARDIERQMRRGRNVSDRDRDFLRDWNDFKNQKKPEDETVRKLDEIKQMLEKTLEVK